MGAESCATPSVWEIYHVDAQLITDSSSRSPFSTRIWMDEQNLGRMTSSVTYDLQKSANHLNLFFACLH